LIRATTPSLSEKRDTNLRPPNFFEAETYPEITNQSRPAIVGGSDITKSDFRS